MEARSEFTQPSLSARSAERGDTEWPTSSVIHGETSLGGPPSSSKSLVTKLVNSSKAKEGGMWFWEGVQGFMIQGKLKGREQVGKELNVLQYILRSSAGTLAETAWNRQDEGCFEGQSKYLDGQNALKEARTNNTHGSTAYTVQP